MRFLIFNLVVVGALFYLFAGGQPFADIDQDGMLGKVTAAVEKTVHSGREVTAAVVDKVMAENTGAPLPPSLTPPPAIEPPKATPIETAMAKPAIQAPAIEVPVQKVVPPIPVKLAAPKAPAIAAPSTITDPAVKKRRAEVMAQGPVTADATVREQSKFMTPRQRRRELHALSEEMELLFASTRGQ